MKITWLGTACVRIEAAGERILFDPFVQFPGGENPNRMEDFLQDEVVCITHGHLDHLMAAAELLDPETPGEATVYCGSVAAQTLSENLEDTSNVVQVRSGLRWRVGEVVLTAHRARHAVPGVANALRALCPRRLFGNFRNALALAWLHPHFPEGKETLLYEVEAEGLRVLVMGSLGLAEDVGYPVGADLLVLPFQGSRNKEREALAVLERLKPKRVLLDHFDDAFPPVSRSVDTRRFKRLVEDRFPEIQVVKPTFGKPVECREKEGRNR